jgi:hypothetical protein
VKKPVNKPVKRANKGGFGFNPPFAQQSKHRTKARFTG